MHISEAQRGDIGSEGGRGMVLKMGQECRFKEDLWIKASEERTYTSLYYVAILELAPEIIDCQ